MDRKVVLKEALSGDYILESFPKIKSVTKLLGGKEIVRMSRYWTYHGGGSWITEWFIKKDKLLECKQAVEKASCELIVQDYDQVQKKYVLKSL